MSHSLHRRGSMESLRHDYLLLVTAASGINSANSKEKLRRVLDLVWEIGPINTGSNEVGTILSGVSVEEIKAGFTEVPRVRCVFDSEEKMREIIGRLIEMDLGISVTVSGPRAEVEKMCRDFGIKPHSANFSLDIWGRREKLPPEEILEFITMCGHGMISKALVVDTIERVKAGKMTPEEGAVRMGSPCVCGFFNPTRAIMALEKYVPKEES
ncbi:MAG: hypothetical protein KHX62_06030 [Firmicutes bacterium]|nr:hypothetical protein [Bacillota bacterium]